MRWFVEKRYHFSHLKRGALDSCHRRKLEEDGSWMRARTLVARWLRRLEFRQWERKVLVIRYPEKQCIYRECPTKQKWHHSFKTNKLSETEIALLLQIIFPFSSWRVFYSLFQCDENLNFGCVILFVCFGLFYLYNLFRARLLYHHLHKGSVGFVGLQVVKFTLQGKSSLIMLFQKY